MNNQNIENYSMNELRSYCKNNNIKLYSKFTKKTELLNFINEQQQNSNNHNILYNNQIFYNNKNSYNDEITAQMLNNEYEENLKQAIEESKNQDKKKLEKYKMERENQDDEYIEALKRDLTNDNLSETSNEEKDELDYQKKITDNELDKIRSVRMLRFS